MFYSRARQVREEKGLTASQVGKLAGCSAAHVREAERGGGRASLATAQRIARAIGCPLDAFLREGDRTVTRAARSETR